MCAQVCLRDCFHWRVPSPKEASQMEPASLGDKTEFISVTLGWKQVPTPLTGHSSAVPCPQPVGRWVGTIVCQFLGQKSQEEKAAHLRKGGLSVPPCWTDREKHGEVLHQENCKPWGKSRMTRLPDKLNNFGFWWVGKAKRKRKEGDAGNHQQCSWKPQFNLKWALHVKEENAREERLRESGMT